MAPKGAPKQEEALPPVEVDPEVKEEEPAELEPPPLPSVILEQSGWEVCKMPTSGKSYYYSGARREARVQPPYYTILNLDETRFREFTKDDIWKAFFKRKTEYKVEDQGALSEDLIDPDSEGE